MLLPLFGSVLFHLAGTLPLLPHYVQAAPFSVGIVPTLFHFSQVGDVLFHLAGTLLLLPHYVQAAPFSVGIIKPLFHFSQVGDVLLHLTGMLQSLFRPMQALLSMAYFRSSQLRHLHLLSWGVQLYVL